jgi:8-oxo-dGTP pyrophosphatase MutT (NUDIX family)
MHAPDELAVLLARRAAMAKPQTAIPTGAPTAAVSAILHWKPGPSSKSSQPGPLVPHVLLMQRAAHPSDPWSGQVSMPGGRSEQQDTSLLATAKRETLEELGIDLDRPEGRDDSPVSRLLGGLAPTQAMARGKRLSLYIQPFVFEVTDAPIPTLNREAEATFWLPLAEAASGALDHRHKYQDERRSLLLPAWRFDERVIWGLTYRMLDGLLRLPTRRPS